MRKVYEPQLKLGQIPIEDIVFDMRSRDEITELLSAFRRFLPIAASATRFSKFSAK